MIQLYTAGHSTRSTRELVDLLAAPGVERIVDVRRYPASRRHPHFNGPALEADLAREGLAYVWLGESLGGRQPERLSADASPNGAWQVPAFRHYADAMTTDTFLAGFGELESLAADIPTAILCAERVWWRCHRRLLSDLWLARGGRVLHLIDPGRSSEHELSEWARVEAGGVTYPGLL